MTSNLKQALQGLRILLIEDDDDTRALIRRFLQLSGAEVHEASNAQQGFQLSFAVKPDLIVSDIGMAGEDGISLMRRIRRVEASCGSLTPAIALTAYTRDEEKERVLNAGFQMHLAKPVTRPHLIAAIENLIPHPALS